MLNKEIFKEITSIASESNASLIAVSKRKPVEDIAELIDLGHLDFGENYVQELVKKHKELPNTIRWHFIGHLQRNKVKEIISFVHMIHSVDSLRLLKEIDNRAAKEGRIVDVLLQVHVAQEESKFGFNPQDLLSLFENKSFEGFEFVRICGIMGMCTYTSDKQVLQGEFEQLKSVFNEVKNNPEYNNNAWKELSMGMSGDYSLALAHGSTMIRVGSLIFGARD